MAWLPDHILHTALCCCYTILCTWCCTWVMALWLYLRPYKVQEWGTLEQQHENKEKQVTRTDVHKHFHKWPICAKRKQRDTSFRFSPWGVNNINNCDTTGAHVMHTGARARTREAQNTYGNETTAWLIATGFETVRRMSCETPIHSKQAILPLSMTQQLLWSLF